MILHTRLELDLMGYLRDVCFPVAKCGNEQAALGESY